MLLANDMLQQKSSSRFESRNSKTGVERRYKGSTTTTSLSCSSHSSSIYSADSNKHHSVDRSIEIFPNKTLLDIDTISSSKLVTAKLSSGPNTIDTHNIMSDIKTSSATSTSSMRESVIPDDSRSTAATSAEMEDEFMTISRNQALLALSLTEPKWEVIGLDHSYEDPDDPKTFEACVDRVTALFWIRMIAIGIVETSYTSSSPAPVSSRASKPAESALIDSYDVLDLSTSTICRNLLQSPKEQPRNPQDVDVDDDLSFANSDGKQQQINRSPSDKTALTIPWWWQGGGSNPTTESLEKNVSHESLNAKPHEVFEQLRRFIQRIFDQHRTSLSTLEHLPFHNYTHSASVVIRANKLLDMILCTAITTEGRSSIRADDDTDGGTGAGNSFNSSLNNNSINTNSNSSHNNRNYSDNNTNEDPHAPPFYEYDVEYSYDEDLDLGRRHPPTFGIRNDPILQISLLFAALVHDVAHYGITNRQLCEEDHPLSLLYNDQSVQEKNSLKIAFDEFLRPDYTILRLALFGISTIPNNKPTTTDFSLPEMVSNPYNVGMVMNEKYRLFRQIVVSSVLTTDIASPEQTVITKAKWKEAFAKRNASHNRSYSVYQENSKQYAKATANHRHQHPSTFNRSHNQINRTASGFSDTTMSLSQKYPNQQKRRGSNVSLMTDCTEDSYAKYNNKRTVQRYSSSGVHGHQQQKAGSVQRSKSYSGSGTVLATVLSQRLLNTYDDFKDDAASGHDMYDNAAETNDDVYDYNGINNRHQGNMIMGTGTNRRGSCVSTFSSDSVAMMRTSTSVRKPRRLSTTVKMQQQRVQRRYSNDSLTDYWQHPEQQKRRASNESFNGSHYLQQQTGVGGLGYTSNSPYDDEYSYDGSEFANDSVAHHQSHVNNSRSNARTTNRRMSNGSYESYAASEWGGDSVALNRKHVHQSVVPRSNSISSVSNRSEIITHRRYPHPQGSDYSLSYDSSSHQNISRQQADLHQSRKHSLDVSTTEGTYDSIVANSIEVNRKRFDEHSNNLHGSTINGKATKSALKKKIVMENDDGDEIDISRYVWNDDSDGSSSFSLTPPSSVEDEYGAYAADYAAKFKPGLTGAAAMHTATSRRKLDDANGFGLNSGADVLVSDNNGKSDLTGEYCGRVIVATTITNKPINRRGSISGALGSSQSTSNPLAMMAATVSAGGNHGSSFGSSVGKVSNAAQLGYSSGSSISRVQGGGPVRRTLNRRASTGTVPSSSFLLSQSLQGGRIDENSTAGFTGSSNFGPFHAAANHKPLTTRRRSMGTISSESSNEALSVQTLHPPSHYKKRLGIRRSMDLSGEVIEVHTTRLNGISHHTSRFSGDDVHDDAYSFISEDDDEDKTLIQIMLSDKYDEPDELKASVVIEALLRVADVGHSLQCWDTYVAWSSKLFHELCIAHENDRGHDPRPTWYDNQIRIMDSYLYPLALQLDETGVFGPFNGVLFVQCLESIRQRWIQGTSDDGLGGGSAITAKFCTDDAIRKAKQKIKMMRFL